MQLLRVISLISSVVLLISADTIFDNINENHLDDFAALSGPEPGIFNDHQANPALDSDLFSNTDPDNTNLEDFSSSTNLLTDARVDNDSAAPCISSSSPITPLKDNLQARSPSLCPNPLDTLDPDFLTTPWPLPNDPNARGSEGENPIYFIGPHSYLCPSEQFGLRSIPVCDSGSHDDIVQDDDIWVIDLINPSVCMYD